MILQLLPQLELIWAIIISHKTWEVEKTLCQGSICALYSSKSSAILIRIFNIEAQRCVTVLVCINILWQSTFFWQVQRDNSETYNIFFSLYKVYFRTFKTYLHFSNAQKLTLAQDIFVYIFKTVFIVLWSMIDLTLNIVTTESNSSYMSCDDTLLHSTVILENMVKIFVIG